MNSAVIGSLATIPSRIDLLSKVVISIIDQLDILNIYLNNYPAVPDFLNHKKIRCYTSQKYGDRADTGKFFPLQFYDGYLFTLDDDLVYPDNYVSSLREKVRLYNHKAFICVHGNILPNTPLESYYKQKKGLHYMRELLIDKQVDIPGTGTMAFHSDIYKVNLDDFLIPCLTDIWVFGIAKKLNIPVISVERGNNWIKPLIIKKDPHSIYEKFNGNDNLPTKIINLIRSMPS